MFGFVLTVCGMLFGVVVFWLLPRRVLQRRRTSLDLVTSMQLRDERDALRGTFEGLQVEVTFPELHPGALADRLVMTPFPRPEFLGPAREGPLATIGGTGDPDFDRARAVVGDEATIRAALDVVTRAGIVAHDIVVRYGQLERTFTHTDPVEPTIRFAADLHRRFAATPDEQRAWLEENARRDPVAAVRERNLRALATVPEGLMRVDAIARSAELDEPLRALAAVLAGSSDVLADIASSTRDVATLAQVADALGALGSQRQEAAMARVREVVRATPTLELVRVLRRYGTVADDGALGIAEPEGGDLAIAEGGELEITRTERGDPPS